MAVGTPAPDQSHKELRPGSLGPRPSPGTRPTELSLADVFRLTRDHRRLVVTIPAVCFAVVTIVTLLLPRSYASTAWFVPQSTDANRSRLAGIASQFGVALPASEQRESPAFYAELLQSQRLLQDVVDTSYTFVVDGVSRTGTLVELYRVRGASAGLRREKAVKKLRQGMSVTADPATGLVKLSVRARWAPLAQQVARRLLDLVSEFNLHRRQSQAAAERTFLEGRVADARAELRNAADAVQNFLKKNRDYQNSPELAFDYDRLSRELTMRQQVYTSLSQSKEQAALEAVRNTPVITIVDPPEIPVKPVPLGLIVNGLVSLVLGTLLSVAVAFGREFMREMQSQ